MVDNATLPAAGTLIATDEVDDGSGPRHFQLVKPVFGVDGDATMVSSTNGLPVQEVGELVGAVEALRMAVNSLARTQGLIMPDTAGRMRVAIDAITAALTLATITTVGTVTTVATVTNQTNVGGVAANEQVPALMRIAAAQLRSRIVVT